MIPQLVTIRYQSRPDKRHTFWIPLLPLYLLLTPLLPLIIIAVVVAGAHYGVNPIRFLIALTRLLASLGGVQVNVAQGATNFHVKLI
jgi:hypothetical protein